ncbi:DUF805 domain-containing protein [Neorhizobium galegae]|uniref:SHOCT domain-containing protein n=1 Tax=Neorhizobium galegae bv. officinalis TaxID=323656 RepID=A0A0T7GAF3_NEOGA|nr:DUF805 domain-containing protein [Neorhizobium galegae]CDZ44271.1 Hypothetical protein NGAL_HAMBI1189_02660 [Neorhizobium galegae bv. officinalis]
MTAYIDAMRRYVDFSGRSTRAQFWFYHLALLGIAVGTFIIDIMISGGREPQPLVSAVAVIGHYIPSLAIIVRRLHDSGSSGWLVLLCLIPGIGIVAFIAFGCLTPTPGPNRYGLPPQPQPHPPAPATAPATSQAANGSVVDRIEKLAVLRASGAIDDAEYAQLKNQILSGVAR